MSRARLVLSSVSLGLIALALLAWMGRSSLLTAYWQVASEWELEDAERAALDACRDPGWMAMLRVLASDLDVGCGDDWVVRSLAGHLTEERVVWIRELAVNPARAPRSRLRSARALMAVGEEAPAGLAQLLADPSLLAQRDVMVAQLAELEESPDWVDPSLAGEVELLKFEQGDDRAVGALLVRLRALALDSVASEEAEHLVRLALESVDFELSELAELQADVSAGAPLGSIPTEVVALLDAHRGACLLVVDAACVELVVELVSALLGADGASWPGVEAGPSVSTPHRLRMFWRVLHGTSAASETAERALLEAGEWVAKAEPRARPGRLLGLVAHPENTYTRDVFHLVGDPTIPLRHRWGSPWSVALAALEVGELADVSVAVYRVAEGVVVVLDGSWAVGVGACGQKFAVRSDEGELLVRGTPLEPETIRVQAMLEVVRGAMYAGNVSRATGMARLAEQTSPLALGTLETVHETMELSELANSVRVRRAAVSRDGVSELVTAWRQDARAGACLERP